MNYDVIVVGGGAAGFFTAINLAEKNRELKIAILERGKEVLSKVRISGGGRCNVTHACFDPRELTNFYPRGEKELLGPFHQFCSGDTIEWFAQRGVELKIEEDGRMFPESNSSATIIDCFVQLAKRYKVEVITGASVQSLYKTAECWKLDTTLGMMQCSELVMATGSNPKIWNMLEGLGHKIVEPVPSLFTFNIKDARLKDLMGLSSVATIKVKGSKLEETGPLLITHWGLSGPGVLRLSAWGARFLAQKNYQFHIEVNWVPQFDSAIELREYLAELRLSFAKKQIVKSNPFELPKRLWERIVQASLIHDEMKWAEVNTMQLTSLVEQLFNACFHVQGKSTFKEEFVTAGGIDLKQVNFKTMQSKVVENLYFVGEVLNIDAITGGFNFQNAWTTGFIAANYIYQRLS